MSFYVTLPSDSSMGLFTDNTVSEFTTQLQTPIVLNGPYEVALVEFTYDHCWDVDMGELVYFYKNENISFSTSLLLQDGENFNDFFQRVNRDLMEKVVQYEIDKAKNLETNQAVDNQAIGEKLSKEWIEQNRVPIIVYNNKKLIFNTIQSDHYFYFRGLLGQLFNIEYVLLGQKTKYIEINTYKDDFYVISNIFIYTDIIKYQYVGDRLAPLLRTVVVLNDARSTQNIIYNSPHYVPTNKSVIENINIRITDEFGKNIRFKRGKSIIKLHFRPVRNGF